MPRLTTERYLQARAFLIDHARPLELTLFEYDFEGAPAWPVLDALAAFQNDDGGFGHGLEPDAHTPSSGALASSVALRVLAHVGAPSSHPMVGSLVDYLVGSLDEASGTWRIVPADAADYPHAPWWANDGLSERFNGYRLNPKAEIVAHLYAIGAGVDPKWLAGLCRSILSEVEDQLSEQGPALEMHDLQAACRLLDADGVPADVSQPLHELLRDAARAGLGAGGGYGLRALGVAPRPDSSLADALADEIVLELDRLLAEQAEDGAWWPAWDWGSPAGSPQAAAWEASKTAWAGVITLDNLRALAANGLIDRG